MRKYFFFSRKHSEHFRDMANMGMEVSITSVNEIPYTLWHERKDDKFLSKYKAKWGDVELVHEGEGNIEVTILNRRS